MRVAGITGTVVGGVNVGVVGKLGRGDLTLRPAGGVSRVRPLAGVVGYAERSRGVLLIASSVSFLDADVKGLRV